MKKSISVFMASLLLLNVNGQVKVAVKGGWNFSTAKAVYAGVKQPTGYTNGFGIGVLAKVPFEGVLHFSPSVMINQRGFIVNPITGSNKKEQYSITYLDLVPSLSIDFPQGANSISVSLGPDFGFTNFGRLKETDNNNVTSSKKLKFGYGELGWFDLGLNASMGYHIKKGFIEIGYLHGLASINNNEENDLRNIRNRMFSFNIGYYFKQTATK